jgi:hypothetical protein
MADGTILNPGAGGDKIDNEDVGARGKITRVKVARGALDVDGGDVTAANPFAVQLSNGAASYNTPSQTQLPSALGQVSMAGSVSVAIASDQSTISVALAGSSAVHVDAALPAGGNVIGAVVTALPSAAALSDTTVNPTCPMVGAAIMGFDGSTWERARLPAVFQDVNAVSIGAIATVWTPAAGKRVRFQGGCISVSAAGSVLFEDNAGGAFVFRTPKLLADTPYNFDLGARGRPLAAADNVLKATLSVAGTITGTLYGCQE